MRESSAGYRAVPTRTPRIPPRAYQVIYEHCQAMERAGVPEHMIDEARRLMSDETFNTMNLRTYVPRDEAGWLKGITAAWAFLADVLADKGFKP